MTENKKRTKHTVNYRDTANDQELFEWIEEKSQKGVFKQQDIIKQILFEAMKSEKNQK